MGGRSSSDSAAEKLFPREAPFNAVGSGGTRSFLFDLPDPTNSRVLESRTVDIKTVRSDSLVRNQATSSLCRVEISICRQSVLQTPDAAVGIEEGDWRWAVLLSVA